MTKDVRAWLEELELGQYADAFVDNAVDLDLLIDLTDADLEKLGVTALGHRKRLLRAITDLGENQGAAEPEGGTPSPKTEQSNTAERRQLTVMFCDIVGSTALSEAMDAEEYRNLIAAYRSAAHKAIEPYDGHIAQYMGDGLLVYFGYPQAHEEDPERAVRAALDTVSAVAASRPGAATEVQVRIGIATGLVVAGDVSADGTFEKAAVLGDTPNLAARLQGLAAPNTVLIAESTGRLVQGRFDLEPKGPFVVKGINKPITAYRATSVRESTRFQAASAGVVGPLLGRDEELGMLWRRWQLARAGEGQVMLLGGEAGIGKSRLAEGLREKVRAERHTVIRFQCSPYHVNSTFYPAILQIERAADFDRDDSEGEKLDKLEALFGSTTDDLWLIAELLSLPTDRYARIELTPEKRRTETIRFLVEHLLSLASTSPVLLILEDAHWIDHSTRALFDALTDEVVGMKVLLVVTHRPELQSAWAQKGHATQLMLSRLGRQDADSLVRSLTGDTALTEGVVEQILQKTDGIPLFVEELTKDVLESGVVDEPHSPAPELRIPSTIQDSLVARLDRLGDAKQVAQVGAMIGRDFPYPLVAAVWEGEEEDLNDGLEQLEAAVLLHKRGQPPDASYSFKHALVRDAAYATLLRDRRRALHRRVASAMRQHEPAAIQMHPELLAHHLTEAGDIDAALEQWLSAGQLSFSRSAALEAQAHLEKGRALIAHHSHDVERAEQELAFCVALGPVYMTTKGAHALETEQIYARARELSTTVGDQGTLFKVAWGQWHVKQLSVGPEGALAFADECLSLSRQFDDEDFVLQAHHAAWSTEFFRGEFGGCLGHAERGQDLYDLERHADHRFTYGGHDPGACGHYFAGMSHWILGRPDEGARCAARARDVARTIEHPFSTVATLLYTAHVAYFRRDHEEVRALAHEGLVLCETLGFPAWLPGLAQLHDWAVVVGERDTAALVRMTERIAPEQVAGQVLPGNVMFLVDACVLLRERERGISVVEKGLNLAEKLGHRWVDAELHRLHAALLMLERSVNCAEAEAKLHLSLQLARKQRAKSLELRTATALARIRAAQGKPEDAIGLLAPIYQAFSEGFDTPDLEEAETLLRELS
jgi:class 3 adenylate cyclase/predicted ATPase